MAVTKVINSEEKQFRPVLVDKVVLDATPTVNSFNSVTSDGVARAIAGASGEVPVVTENDNGKVLRAVYDEGGPAVEWGEAVTVDQTYDSTSTNAQSGTAVAEAVSGIAAVPSVTSTDNGKVLKASYDSVAGTGSFSWETQSIPTVDQTYDSASANAQSGVAVAEAVGGLLPSITDNASKVLAVNSGATGLEWVTQGGSGGDLPAVGAYTLRFKFADPTFEPVAGTHSSKGSWTAVDASNGIWDWSYADSDWGNAFYTSSTSLLPNIDTWVIDGDMTGVTRLVYCFQKANKLKGFKVTKGQTEDSNNSTYSMFEGCGALEYVDYSEDQFNTHQGDNTFKDCVLLASVPSIKTKTSSGTKMFYRCQHLRNVTITALAYSSTSMFSGCTSLEHVNVMSPAWSGSLQDCKEMFTNCSNLREIPPFSLTSNYNYNCDSMFSGCVWIQYIPPWVAHMNKTSAKNMFSGCSNLRTIPYIKTDSVTDVSNMFSGCSAIESGADTLYQQMSQQATPPATTAGCFTNCGSSTPSGTAALAQIPASYGGTGA